VIYQGSFHPLPDPHPRCLLASGLTRFMAVRLFESGGLRSARDNALADIQPNQLQERVTGPERGLWCIVAASGRTSCWLSEGATASLAADPSIPIGVGGLPLAVRRRFPKAAALLEAFP